MRLSDGVRKSPASAASGDASAPATTDRRVKSHFFSLPAGFYRRQLPAALPARSGRNVQARRRRNRSAFISSTKWRRYARPAGLPLGVPIAWRISSNASGRPAYRDDPWHRHRAARARQPRHQDADRGRVRYRPPRRPSDCGSARRFSRCASDKDRRPSRDRRRSSSRRIDAATSLNGAFFRPDKCPE